VSPWSNHRLAFASCLSAAVTMTCGIAIELVTWSQGTLTTNVAADLAILPAALLMGFLGLLITIRRPENRIGWLFSATAFVSGWIVLADGYSTHAVIGSPGSLPLGAESAWFAGWIWIPVEFALLLYLPLVFPNGKLLSNRWRWVVRLSLLQMVLLMLGFAFTPGRLDGYPIDNPFGIETPGNVFAWVTGLGFVLIFVCVALAAVSVILRSRRSSGLERLQIKWLALAAVVVAASLAVGLAFDAFDFTVPVAFSSVVLASGLAVLRYRLYDLDRVISRTIVFGILTVVLGATYVGLVLAGQAVFSRFAGGSNLAIAGSTLVVAALFLPVRGRIQRMVDRRFYRRRYDAQRTLEAFGARLRHEVELATLQAELRGAVDRTMKPEHVSLWLRGPAR
jgi:hypothetical protein